jgi:TonB-dependent SusC/RagA subfamily outer membrane receptor
MIAFAYYLLKVIICSGILYGYYLLALRNRIFHHWNRYYLLVTILLSLMLPLIRIPIVQEVKQTPNEAVRILEIVTTGDAYVQELDNGPALHISTEQYVGMAYLLISLFFLFVMIRTLIRIRQMIRHHKIQTIEDFFFVNTSEKGTPFSFFRYIFWHEDILPDSTAGQHILKHEIAHVRENHTHDKLFLNLVLIVYWCNPFFWLIRREMAMIHEFIADKQSVDQQDTAAFAAMILQAAYPRHQFALTNNFFHSPIKRRLKMLIKTQNSRVTYITRLLALPLLLLVVAAFTLKPSRINEIPTVNKPATEKNWTFIIDAGHGGEDLGVRTKDGFTEKSLALAIAKKIKELNTNPAFNIILSRETDILQPVREKVDFAVSQNPDAFISIHINGAPTIQTNGIEVFLGTKNNSFQKESMLLGSLINQEMAKVYQTLDTLKKRSEKGIWVLDAPQINYPAAMIECGYLTNPTDRAFISDPKNQEKIAKNILAALERYTSLTTITTKPEANQYAVNPIAKKAVLLEDTGVTTLLGKTSFSISTDDPLEKQRMSDKMVVINGKKGNMGDLINKTVEADSGIIYPENNPNALKMYGEAARKGVTVFYNAKVWDTPKKTALKDTLPPGIKSVDITEDGSVIVIDSKGKAEKITKEEAYKRDLIPLGKLEKLSTTNSLRVNGTVSLNGTTLEPLYVLDGVTINTTSSKDALDLLVKPDDIEKIDVLKGQSAIDKYGEKGKNGVVSITTKTGPKHDFSKSNVELTDIKISDDSKLFTQVEILPKFPSGEDAMYNYIKKQVSSNEIFLKEKNTFSGNCTVRFIVDKYGRLSNFSVENTPAPANNKLAQLVIEILQKGPAWNPALQNGNKVKAVREITFTN